MDQMIQQIIDYSQKYKVYDESDINNIAAYLTGQNSFERVIKILAQPAETYYSNYYEHIREITDAVKKDPSLFKRLGRHLKLIEYMNPAMYSRIITGMAGEDLSLSDIFIKGEIGAENLLAFAVEINHYKIDLKQSLETVYNINPEAIVKYLNKKDLKTHQRFPVSAFLIGKIRAKSKLSIFTKIFNLNNTAIIEQQFNSDVIASIVSNLRILPIKNSLEKYLNALGGYFSGEERQSFVKIYRNQHIDSFGNEK